MEVDAIVADYFAMLTAELRGETVSKADHRRRLLPLLNNRSEQSVEYKHCNISAVLCELGVPPIRGYKPRWHYQEALAFAVAARLASDRTVEDLVRVDVDAVVPAPAVEDILAAMTPPPRLPDRPARLASEPPLSYAAATPVRPTVNYLEREARNSALGAEGERFALRYEQARLIAAGQERLADRIEHISRSRGDGAGFDILSFETSGEERLIEVKTTKYAAEVPFLVTRNELDVSRQAGACYHLYRLFDFRDAPRFFSLCGSLARTCALDPAVFSATVAPGISRE